MRLKLFGLILALDTCKYYITASVETRLTMESCECASSLLCLSENYRLE